MKEQAIEQAAACKSLRQFRRRNSSCWPITRRGFAHSGVA